MQMENLSNGKTQHSGILNRNVEKRQRIEYRIEYFISVPFDVVCKICQCVMNEPVRANGTTYCRLCYLSQDKFSSSDKMLPYHPDLEIAAKIQKLECYCYYRPDGCEWKGTVEQLDYHFEECQYKIFKCQYCETFYQLKDQQTHTSECIMEQCKCGKVLRREAIQEHRSICSKYITCAKCYLRIFSSDFENHINTCESIYCLICEESFQQSSHVNHIERVKGTETFSSHIQLMESENRATKNQVNLLKKENLELKETVSKHDDILSEIRQTGEGRKDGSLLWVIENVLEKYKKAKENNEPIFSPSFCSHENGYKMGAKLYLNGDGSGEGEFISLYFFLNKGPFDELLTWPFANKVALQIMTFGDKDPSIEIFTPEKDALSFEKPKGKRNIPSGFSRFAKQDILYKDTYVQNGKLFIKIITDTANMYHP